MSRFVRAPLGVGCLLFAGFAAFCIGCGQDESKSSTVKVKTADHKSDAADVADSKHEGWWCNEHGVPESVCGQCSAKAAADCKKKGDWCKEHDRPESQCFICHPKLREKFAAEYRAKYGKEPPALDEKDDKKEEKKG